MKKAFGCVLILAFAFLVVQCVTLDSHFHSIDSATVIFGKWHNSRGQEIEFPLNAKDGVYLKLAQKQKDDTKLWKDFMEKQNLTIQDVWPRRFALLSKIYGKEYPLADENGIQTGIKLKKDTDDNIFSTAVTIIPQSLILGGRDEVKISENHRYILFRGKVFEK